MRLEIQGADGSWLALGKGATDMDGRLRDLLPDDFNLQPGVYRLSFDTTVYFKTQKIEKFLPACRRGVSGRKYAAALSRSALLSPFGYSTYRGS